MGCPSPRPDVKKLFYTNSPALPPTPAGPAYNLYSKVLHSFGDKVYAFAFDDAVGRLLLQDRFPP